MGIESAVCDENHRIVMKCDGFLGEELCDIWCFNVDGYVIWSRPEKPYPRR